MESEILASVGHIFLEGLLQPKEHCLFSEMYTGKTLAPVSLQISQLVKKLLKLWKEKVGCGLEHTEQRQSSTGSERREGHQWDLVCSAGP